MSWIAEYDTHGMEFPTCVHVTKTTHTMTHGATYVPIENGKAVRDENAKLRELVLCLLTCLSDSSDACDKCPVNGGSGVFDFADFCDSLLDRMRELGVEVGDVN